MGTWTVIDWSTQHWHFQTDTLVLTFSLWGNLVAGLRNKGDYFGTELFFPSRWAGGGDYHISQKAEELVSCILKAHLWLMDICKTVSYGGREHISHSRLWVDLQAQKRNSKWVFQIQGCSRTRRLRAATGGWKESEGVRQWRLNRERVMNLNRKTFRNKSGTLVLGASC